MENIALQIKIFSGLNDVNGKSSFYKSICALLLSLGHQKFKFYVAFKIIINKIIRDSVPVYKIFFLMLTHRELNIILFSLHFTLSNFKYIRIPVKISVAL